MLPFSNLSKEEENAFFAGGMQDQILTDLARVADLKVISRTSTIQYKSEVARNLREIGRATRRGACGRRNCSAHWESRARQRSID